MSYQQPYGFSAPPPQTQLLVQPYRCSTAHVVIAWVCAVLTVGYLLPWAIGATRNRSNVAATALVNLLLGWSLVGWVVALVMACGSERPVVVVHNSYAPPALVQPPQPWGQVPPPYGWAQPAEPWAQAPQPWSPPPAAWSSPQPPALPPARSTPEHTVVDPAGSEPTRPLPRSPWEPDHRA